jgi:hypothetical protein
MSLINNLRQNIENRIENRNMKTQDEIASNVWTEAKAGNPPKFLISGTAMKVIALAAAEVNQLSTRKAAVAPPAATVTAAPVASAPKPVTAAAPDSPPLFGLARAIQAAKAQAEARRK